MNRLLFKDFRVRRPFKKAETIKTSLLYFRFNRVLYRKFSIRGRSFGGVFHRHSLKITYSLMKNKNYHFSKARNRCLVTGSSHSVYSDFRLSRMALREDILSAKVPGVNKSSW